MGTGEALGGGRRARRIGRASAGRGTGSPRRVPEGHRAAQLSCARSCSSSASAATEARQVGSRPARSRAPARGSAGRGSTRGRGGSSRAAGAGEGLPTSPPRAHRLRRTLTERARQLKALFRRSPASESSCLEMECLKGVEYLGGFQRALRGLTESFSVTFNVS